MEEVNVVCDRRINGLVSHGGMRHHYVISSVILRLLITLIQRYLVCVTSRSKHFWRLLISHVVCVHNMSVYHCPAPFMFRE